MQLVTDEQAVLRVTLGDETWDFDDGDLTLEQMISIEEATGQVSADGTEQTVGQWVNAVMQKRARALKVLVWWLQGRTVRPEQIDVKIGDLHLELVAKEKPKAPKAVVRAKRETEPSPSS